jgi:hypothetical protein
MEDQGLSTRDLAGGSRTQEPPPREDPDGRGRETAGSSSAPPAEAPVVNEEEFVVARDAPDGEPVTADPGHAAPEDREARAGEPDARDETEFAPEDREAPARETMAEDREAPARDTVAEEREAPTRDTVAEDREAPTRDTGADDRGAAATTHNGAPTSTSDVAAGESAALLPEDENATFTRRWEELQTAFVDEPRQTVEQADELVAQLMKRLAEGFAAERERLEQQWGRGEDISTEDLRVALQRYRAFFQRLLSA